MLSRILPYAAAGRRCCSRRFIFCPSGAAAGATTAAVAAEGSVVALSSSSSSSVRGRDSCSSTRTRNRNRSRNFSSTSLVGHITTATAGDAAKLSCYEKIDYCIHEDSPVLDAIKRFAAHNIGCLVTTDSKGAMTGVISERDYITKVELFGRTPTDTMVKEIATTGTKLITTNPNESVERCMEKMLESDIRHLPLVDDSDDGGELVGMISIKDLVQTTVKEKEDTIKTLAERSLGKIL